MKSTRIAVLFAMGLALSAARAADDRHTVVPGESIGVIKLGMNVKQVHDAMAAWGTKPLITGKLGGPGAWLDKQAGCAIEGYQTDSLGHERWGNVMKVFYVNNTVAQISTQSVAYMTKKGATTRHTSSEFCSAHPSLHPIAVRESWGGTIRPYDSETQGLAVTYSVIQNGTEVRNAQEIIVHKRGVPVMLESARHEGNVAEPALTEQKKAIDEGATSR